MRKILLTLMTILLIGTVALAQDSDPLTNSGYTDDISAHLHVWAYMTGIEYSLNYTDYYVNVGVLTADADVTDPASYPGGDPGGLMPNNGDVSDPITLQNDGGVNIDISFQIEDEDHYTAGGGDWANHTGSYTPGVDEFLLMLWVGGTDAAAPVTRDFGNAAGNDAIAVAAWNEVQDGLHFDHSTSYSRCDADGLDLVAYDPLASNHDQVYLYLGYVAPSSATNPGSHGNAATECHMTTIAVDAKLAD